LCKTIAAHLKLPLYSIAEQQGYDLNRGDRIKKLCLANTLLEKDRRALLLFDEMEDILSANLLTGESRSGENAGSKIFVNRMLEKNALPTFWTANDVSRCDPAILRRMTLAIEMKAPPRHNRRVVLKRILDQEKLHLPENEIHSLAHEFDDAPALIKNAVRAASLAGGKKDQVKFVLKNSRKAMGRRARSQQSENSIKFMPELTNADLDLAQFTNRLARKEGSRNFSLCLHGPAGTGKSAYARYLAEKIGMEVMHMRASDLISMWVGETERKIAEAFEKAVTDRAFLVFDEADSFLRDRHLSKSSWEVTAVNEMLTWMESHPLPFACTTNLMEMLDAASLRRFTFKMCFDYMTPDQMAASFRHFFSLEPPPSIMALDRLTPGDFALVRNKAKIIGQADDPQAILTMLRQECDAKPGGAKPIGFIREA
jgi:AAA+ superfamily predicted ATPase